MVLHDTPILCHAFFFDFYSEREKRGYYGYFVFFSISKEKAEKLIEPFINNDEHKSAIYEGIKSFFSKRRYRTG